MRADEKRSLFCSRTPNQIGRRITAKLLYAATLIGLLVFAGCDSKEQRAKDREAKAEAIRKQEERQRQVELRVQERLAKEARNKANHDAARASVKLKEWSFRITSDVYGLHISDGPIIFIEYTVTNPSKCWLVDARWSLSLTDERGTRLGIFTLRSFSGRGLDFVRPGEVKKGDFILGFKDLGFSPRLVEAAGLSLSGFELQEEMPEGEKQLALEQEKQRKAVEEANSQAAENKLRRQREIVRNTFEFYSLQATNGDGFAQFRLGEFYLNGQGTETNIELARLWLNSAATNGRTEAVKLLQERFKRE